MRADKVKKKNFRHELIRTGSLSGTSKFKVPNDLIFDNSI